MAKLGSEQDKQTTEGYRKRNWRLATAGTRSPIIAPVTRFLLGLPVFILPTQTDEYFAWTIAVPMTAVFLGGCYWASAALALIASRRPLWAQTRVSMAVALVFAPLVTAATFIHLDQFHTDKPIGIIWVIAYGIYPPMLALVMRRQLREPGVDPPRTSPLAGWVRALLILEAVVLIPLGIAMFALPGEFAGDGGLAGLWPWGLTELTSQICGAWVLALGVFAGAIAWENDNNRVAPYLAAFGLLGLLQAIALAREGDDLQWSEPAAYAFVGYLVATFVLSAYGLLRARRAPEPDPTGS
ncbi:MAG: hypothetical protein ACRDL6_04185 [Solirubrobacterales bacterium]